MIGDNVKAIKGRKYGGSSLRDGKLYHDLPFNGLDGFKSHRGRTRQRIEQIASLVNVYEKYIVDIGCSVGGLSLGMVEKGAEFVDGIDYDMNSISVAEEASSSLGFNGNTSFSVENIDLNLIKSIEDMDIVLWLSQWMWFVKQYGLDTGKQALFEISRNNKVLVFESAADDAMAAIKGTTQDDIKKWLYENTCYNIIDEHESVGGWHNRKLFVCKNPVPRIKDKWHASMSVIDRIAPDKIKKTFKQKNLWAQEREVKALKRLESSKHFPTVIEDGDGYMVMQYAGRENMLTKDLISQAHEIIADLKKARIKHRDIRSENLLVLSGNLSLIDFGWCIFDDEKDTPVESATRFKDHGNIDEVKILKLFI